MSDNLVPTALSRIAAPMVNQSDLPFRTLVQRYGATLAYTQMLKPECLLNDQEYLEFHLRDLTMNPSSLERPVIVQLCGNDPGIITQAGRKLQGYCEGIGARLLENTSVRGITDAAQDLNLGCPQQVALDGHFGAYLLGKKDWPLVEEIGAFFVVRSPFCPPSLSSVSAMSRSFTVPVAAKLRLCQPAPQTLDLAQRLEACGASWLTLHARTVAPRRRRHGAADLTQVKRLKDNLKLPIISNGNVRVYEDIEENLKATGADGLMVAETLLGNPWSVHAIFLTPGSFRSLSAVSSRTKFRTQ